MKNPVLVLATLGILAAAAFAQSNDSKRGKVIHQKSKPEWQQIATGFSDPVFYYNTRLLSVIDSKLIRIWIKMKPVSEVVRNDVRDDIVEKLQSAFIGQNVSLADVFADYSYTLESNEVNCAHNQIKVVEVRHYNRRGKEIGKVGPIKGPMENVSPETYEARIVTTVCDLR